MNSRDPRKKLIELGAPSLADALIGLCSRNDDAAALVDRLVSTPKENQKRFKAKMAGLKRSRRFIDWREVSDFARVLEALLADLRAGVDDPRTGMELVASFFECDNSTFERCDDSNGIVSSVFSFDARDLFVYYAAQFEDKDWISELLLKLYERDDYATREVLLDAASEFLPNESLRRLAGQLWQRAENEEPASRTARHWLRGVESLARQLGDAALFEKASLASWEETPISVCLMIAQVHFENGGAGKALAWLERMPQTNPHYNDERDSLLLNVYRQLGNDEEAAATAWRIFRNHRSGGNLDVLLEVIGEDNRSRIIEEQAREIQSDGRLHYSDAAFLLEMGRAGDAETYILDRADQLDGDLYTTLLSLGKSLEATERWLATVAIYRALLDSILRRALAKYYHHGVRYLKKLDALAPEVEDWRNLLPHEAYKNGLFEAHGRKKSFWSKYGS